MQCQYICQLEMHKVVLYYGLLRYLINREKQNGDDFPYNFQQLQCVHKVLSRLQNNLVPKRIGAGNICIVVALCQPVRLFNLPQYIPVRAPLGGTVSVQSLFKILSCSYEHVSVSLPSFPHICIV